MDISRLMITTVIGMVGALLTTLAYVPQVIKTWKTQSVKALSKGLSMLFLIGTLFWLIYGILINQLPVVISNAVMMILSGLLLVFNFIYGKTNDQKEKP